MQIAVLYQDAVQQLVQAGVDEAQADAAQLLEFFFGFTRSQLILQGGIDVDENQAASFRKVLNRRIAREPLQYITGSREFWSLDFIVSPAVLIPRPETEFLLDWLLSALAKNGMQPRKVLDMCTGSGVIAVVLARELTADIILAVDHSRAALQIAARNVVRHTNGQQINLVCSDLFSALQESVSFELIVANPPYIVEDDLAGLDPEVREWEPESALISGFRGLDIIKKIAEHAPFYLKSGGWLCIEIGADQGDAVYSLFADHEIGVYEHVEVIKDWSDRPRVLIARKRKSA